jgi:hypothetical protein
VGDRRTLDWLTRGSCDLDRGIALVLIFALDTAVFIISLRDRRRQHQESAAQMELMRSQSDATQDAALAAKASTDALVNSERAWVVAELIPQAVKFIDNRWYRFVGDKPVAMSTAELLAGHHLKYKLKLTNMGRTPAQIFCFTIRYTCLEAGVTDLPDNAGGNVSSHRAFEQFLAAGAAVEIEDPVVDVGVYMRGDEDAIEELRRTAVVHGEVKYRHMFSTEDDCYVAFCYSYTASQQRLSSVGRLTKQRQQKAD